MSEDTFLRSVGTTLKLQPVVLLYSLVSICSKYASRQLPARETGILSFFWKCLMNWKLVLLVAGMFGMLAAYAFIWQIIIKDARIGVVYANKSSYLFWTQLAAVFLFGESFSWCNLVGIGMIFSGILLTNCEREK
ncbi:MAG: hypothetical protein IJS14_10080 [Lentisphaeria bacterium]|nr:hypothetical protein [Lentisphaeria bacterium]